ncbi:chloride channel protein [Anaerovorax odorimutans]|uniref:Chloride channel protein n=1 Tax=Anaerovorax odorimutans TaxID=109327 RepID=A0ABT1RLD6_9FIRM|nr:chloride channel protein [Anaerovorax odorimutans]MCQ4636006.1 chloride channel protein [Anaerovorax odorimutans]
MGKITKRSLGVFALFSLCLGACAGAVVWALLRIMNLGIHLVWDVIPESFGHPVVYNFIACLLGGLIIGLWQTKFGILPDTLEGVMADLKQKGTYPYNRLHILAVSALLPLIFGGSLGPEAGLTGIIVGLCCWIGDRLKYKGAEVKELAQAGIAATLGVIFNSPFVGIANNFENKDLEDEEPQKAPAEKLEMKKAKTMVYVAAVIGALGAMGGLSHLFGGGMGIARFGRDVDITFSDWKWFPVFAVISILCGMLYMLCNRITSALGERIIGHRIISCMLAGLFLAALGTLFPWTMFSGEHEMSEMMEVWQQQSFAVLFLTALVKLILINLCVNLGWRGGNIFPVIFSGVCMGFAMAMITGAEPVFAVAVCVSALCGYIMRKPLTVIGVLLLCFPITIIIPMAAAAYAGSVVPVFGILKKKGKTESM